MGGSERGSQESQKELRGDAKAVHDWQMMDPALSIFLLCVGLLLVVIFLRYGWRAIQVNRAVRSALSDDSITVLKIRSAVVFRDCGSARAAFMSSVCNRDYDIYCRSADGRNHVLSAQADFHPVSASLRSINISKPNEARELAALCDGP